MNVNIICVGKIKENFYTDAIKEYAAAYGPLTIDTAEASCADRWNWVNEPWPWQEGGC